MAADADDDSGGGRPSFTAFWKRGKDKRKKRDGGNGNARADKRASDNDGSSSTTGSRGGQSQSPQSPSHAGKTPLSESSHGTEYNDQTAREKAQNRRAQVRKAQIQHRQRKANYVKQLELDISELRDLIAQAQQDTALIRKDNDCMMDILKFAPPNNQNVLPGATVLPTTDFAIPDFGPTPGLETNDLLSSGQMSDLSLNQQILPVSTGSEMFGNINLDDITVSLGMNDVLGTPCFAISSDSSSNSMYSYNSPPMPVLDSESPAAMPPTLNPQQEKTAINWILALENVCWNHFSATDFHHHLPNDAEESNNHALMATALCLNNAPESLYTDRNQFEGVPTAGAHRPSPTVQWQAAGLNMSSLYGLSQYQTGPTETTPIEAWFELAAKYPLDVLFANDVLQTLLLELKGFVRCVYFGAAMERASFETTVTRILGPPPFGAFEYVGLVE